MKTTNFLIFILIFLLFANLTSATCTSSQVDINSASLQDLDKLTGVGPTTAQKIVDTRLFSTVDDLLRVMGIGDKKLADIKLQGLACVSNSEGETATSSNENDLAFASEEPETIDISTNQNITQSNKVNTITPFVILSPSQDVSSESIINLNSEDALSTKESVVYESRNELVKKYAIYAFAIFLVFIIVVLLIKG